MERKRVIVGVVVLVAAGVIAAVMWGGEGDADDAPVAELDSEASSRNSGGGSGFGSSGGSSGSSAGGPMHASSSRAPAVGDGGVRRVRVPNPNVERPPPGENTHGALQQPAEDAERSAGWRLGQARARIELVQTRVTHLRQAVADAERGGDEAATERQRTILRRFEARLTALRAEEPALEAQARQDGTLGDVERGMQEGVEPTLPTRAPPADAP